MFLVVVDMLAAKRQTRKRVVSKDNAPPDSNTAVESNSDDAGSNDREGVNDHLRIYPPAVLLLAGPSATMSFF